MSITLSASSVTSSKQKCKWDGNWEKEVRIIIAIVIITVIRILALVIITKHPTDDGDDDDEEEKCRDDRIGTLWVLFARNIHKHEIGNRFSGGEQIRILANVMRIDFDGNDIQDNARYYSINARLRPEMPHSTPNGD